MISYSSEIYRPYLMEMWKLCFGDNDEFIRFYFVEIYHNDNTLILFNENNIPVASLQILPYIIKIGDDFYNAGYISGAMTHPDHRKKGYMQQLLKVAFDEMKKKEFTFSFLIPQEEWLFEFYARYGYEKAFPKSVETIDLKKYKGIDYKKDVKICSYLTDIPWDEFFLLYTPILVSKKGVVLKDLSQLELFLKDLFIEEGYIYYVKSKGLAFVIQKGKTILVKEIVLFKEECKESLFAAIGDTYQTDEVILQSYDPASENKQYYGMIKVLDQSKFNQPFPKDAYMSMMMD